MPDIIEERILVVSHLHFCLLVFLLLCWCLLLLLWIRIRETGLQARINKYVQKNTKKENEHNLQLRKLAAIEDSFKVIEHGLQHLSSVGSVGGLVLDDVLRTQEVRCKDDSEVPRVHFGLHRKLGHFSQEEHQKHQQRVILRGKVRNHLLDFKQSITKNERSLRKCK